MKTSTVVNATIALDLCELKETRTTQKLKKAILTGKRFDVKTTFLRTSKNAISKLPNRAMHALSLVLEQDEIPDHLVDWYHVSKTLNEEQADNKQTKHYASLDRFEIFSSNLIDYRIGIKDAINEMFRRNVVISIKFPTDEITLFRTARATKSPSIISKKNEEQDDFIKTLLKQTIRISDLTTITEEKVERILRGHLRASAMYHVEDVIEQKIREQLQSPAVVDLTGFIQWMNEEIEL